jgi:hypothetical protein
VQSVNGDQFVDVRTVRRWVRWFIDGELRKADLSDKTCSVSPVTASDLLHQVRVEEHIRENRRIKQNKLSLYYLFLRRKCDTLLVTLDSEKYDGYARLHTSTRARGTIKGLEFPVLRHPPYCSDLAPSDFHLFPNLKEHLKSQRYSCDEKLKCAVRKWFKKTPCFNDGFQNLVQRWRQCTEVRGDFEKSVSKFMVIL